MHKACPLQATSQHHNNVCVVPAATVHSVWPAYAEHTAPTHAHVEHVKLLCLTYTWWQTFAVACKRQQKWTCNGGAAMICPFAPALARPAGFINYRRIMKCEVIHSYFKWFHYTIRKFSTKSFSRSNGCKQFDGDAKLTFYADFRTHNWS